jgi:serine/threonine protein kinase
MPLSEADRLGPYEILAPIGAGGMGEVYRARDTKLKREVALKVLPDAFARDPERMARFQLEAEVLASLNHPNIAHIYGVEDGALVMELVEGESPKGPMPFADAWKIASQMAEALKYAHDKGVIHRDLKPGNVKVTPDGVVKLLVSDWRRRIAPMANHGPAPGFAHADHERDRGGSDPGHGGVHGARAG